MGRQSHPDQQRDKMRVNSENKLRGISSWKLNLCVTGIPKGNEREWDISSIWRDSDWGFSKKGFKKNHTTDSRKPNL